MLRQKVCFTTYGIQTFSVFTDMPEIILNIRRPRELKSVHWKDKVWLIGHIISQTPVWEKKWVVDLNLTPVWGLQGCVWCFAFFIFITIIPTTCRIECLCSLELAGIAYKSAKPEPLLLPSPPSIVKISCINLCKVKYSFNILITSNSKAMRKCWVL